MRFQMFESAFLILLLFSISDLGIVSSQSEKQLLLQLKNSLKYDSTLSTKLINWNESGDVCRWSGVRCDSSSRISALDLSGEAISAGIDDSNALFKLTHLQSLSLAQNIFDSVKLPARFGQLTELKYLNLSSSGFSGQIPSSFSNLTRLVVLDLSSKFSSSFTLKNPDFRGLIRNFANLRELYLDLVQISANGGEWSSAVASSLPNLRVLSLSSANLRGPLDSSLLKLRSLSVIRLDGNTLSSPFPSFLADLPNLKVLSMSSCGLTGAVPSKLFLIKSLQTVDLGNNRELGGSFPEFPVNGSLESLLLSYTKFSGKLPNSIGNLRMLSNLDLRSCSFFGPIPSTIKNLNLLVYLDLSLNKFSNSIPSLAFLKNLNVLNLRSNRLTGKILDSSWKGLENLEFLDLSENSLQGEIPQSFFTLPLLKYLSLSNNTFSSSIKISTNTPSPLESLDLSMNLLEGSVPRILFELRNLSSLSLSHNRLDGSLQLSDFINLKNLVSLDLSHSGLSVIIKKEVEVSKMFPRLGTLKLASCKLRNIPNLRNQSSLMMLDLAENEMRGEIPNWLWDGFLRYVNFSHNHFSHFQEPYNLRKLDYLNLHANELVGRIPSPLSSAVVLDFSNNKFSSISPEIGDSLQRIMFFSAADNQITGEIPSSFCNAFRIDMSLDVLDLSNNSFHGGIPSCLLNNTLKVLNLGRNNLNGSIPDTFPLNCSLETLDLSRNVLEGKVPESLARCTELELLDFTDNALSSTFPCQLSALSNLRVLVLRSNKFHGDMNCLANNSWQNLQIIDFASNDITGFIPPKIFQKLQALIDDTRQQHFDHLHFQMQAVSDVYYQDSVTITIKGHIYELEKIQTIFTTIDISDNNVQGEIPDTIGEMKSLYLLNFSHNSLSGLIPSSLARAVKLESLDLSSNCLGGQIPSGLARLTSLAVLNLSYNQLVGMIPQGSQFQTFTESSYSGNKGLCGFPLDEGCLDAAAPAAAAAAAEEEEFFEGEILVSVALGFGVGVGIILVPVLVCKRWRSYYNKWLNRILLLLLRRRRRRNPESESFAGK